MRFWDRAFARSESLGGEWSSLLDSGSGFLLGTSGVLVGLDGSLRAGWSSIFWESLDVETSGRIGDDAAVGSAFGNWRGFAGAIRTACSVVPLFWPVWFGLTTGFGWLRGGTGVIWSTKLRLTSSRDEIWLWASTNFPSAICDCSSLAWRRFVASVSCFFSDRHSSSSEFFIPTSFLRFRMASSFSASCCFRSVIVTISRAVSSAFCAFSRACTILHSMLRNSWRTTSRVIELFSATLSAEPPSDTLFFASAWRSVWSLVVGSESHATSESGMAGTGDWLDIIESSNVEPVDLNVILLPAMFSVCCQLSMAAIWLCWVSTKVSTNVKLLFCDWVSGIVITLKLGVEVIASL